MYSSVENGIKYTCKNKSVCDERDVVGGPTTLEVPKLFKPLQELLLVHSSTDPTPCSASLCPPAEMLDVPEIATHGYSRAAMVPAGAPGAAVVASWCTMVQVLSV